MPGETGIGGLAVTIGADISGFVSGLDRADRSTEKFTTKIDKRLLQPLAKVGAAAAAAGTAIYLFTRRASDMLDELAKTSQKVGVSVESLSALKHAASLAGASFETLTNGLRFMAKNMADMQAGTGEAKDAFKALQIQVEDAQGNLKDTEQMLLELADKFAGMEDGAGKTAIAMRIFGRSGADLIPFLNNGRDGIEALRKEAERLGIVFSTEAAKKAEEFNDNVERLTRAVQGLHVEMAGPFITAMNNAALAMLEARKAGKGLFETLRDGFQSMFALPDAAKWQEQMIEATNEMHAAHNDLLRSRRNFEQVDSRATRQNLANAEARIAAAQKEVERLRAIEKIMTGEERFGRPPKDAAGKPKKKAPGLDKGDDEKTAEQEAKARMKALMDQAAIEEQVYGDLFKLTAEKQEEEFLAEKAHQDRMRAAIADAWFGRREDQIAFGEQEIEFEKEKARRKAEIHRNEQREVGAFWSNMGSLTNTGNKKLFEIGKVAAISKALIDGYSAVLSAYKWGTSLGGPWLGAAFAAAAAAATGNMIANIKAQQFGGGGGGGGGGGVPVPVTQGASQVTGQPAEAGARQTTVINLQGDTFSQRDVRMLLERINEANRDGGRIRIA